MVVQLLNTGKYDDTNAETVPAGLTDESQFAFGTVSDDAYLRIPDDTHA
jgi:hypothetical protein